MGYFLRNIIVYGAIAFLVLVVYKAIRDLKK